MKRPDQLPAVRQPLVLTGGARGTPIEASHKPTTWASVHAGKYIKMFYAGEYIKMLYASKYITFFYAGKYIEMFLLHSKPLVPPMTTCH